MQQPATCDPNRVDNARVSVDHYENFPVASLLCPPRLRPAVAAIYWFARTADDLADEGDVAAAQRLVDLAEYRSDLLAVAAGSAPGPRWQRVFDPLRPVIAEWSLPLRPFTDLLSAFEQDVTKHRYRDRAELLDYCRRSADPVGRLLLHLYRVDDADALRQSDAICSALQLINFWQDLRIDLQRGRVYLPQDDCARHCIDAEALLDCRPGPALQALLAEEVDWARGLMVKGAPLVHRIGGRAGWELRLVVQGGLRILDRIAASGFDTLAQRPRLGARDAVPMLWRALCMRRDGGVLAGAAR